MNRVKSFEGFRRIWDEWGKKFGRISKDSGWMGKQPAEDFGGLRWHGVRLKWGFRRIESQTPLGCVVYMWFPTTHVYSHPMAKLHKCMHMYMSVCGVRVSAHVPVCSVCMYRPMVAPRVIPVPQICVIFNWRISEDSGSEHHTFYVQWQISEDFAGFRSRRLGLTFCWTHSDTTRMRASDLKWPYFSEWLVWEATQYMYSRLFNIKSVGPSKKARCIPH